MCSHVLSCTCSHLFFIATVGGLSHSHHLTHEEPEAQGQELCRYTEKLAGGRARVACRVHPEYSVRFSLGEPQRPVKGD